MRASIAYAYRRLLAVFGVQRVRYAAGPTASGTTTALEKLGRTRARAAFSERVLSHPLQSAFDPFSGSKICAALDLLIGSEPSSRHPRLPHCHIVEGPTPFRPSSGPRTAHAGTAPPPTSGGRGQLQPAPDPQH